MTPRKFRSKPVVIEAKQWEGTPESLAQLMMWPGFAMAWRWHSVSSDRQTVSNLMLHTLEGKTRVIVGDWIIRGTEGEFYPCKDSVFRAKYEEVLE